MRPQGFVNHELLVLLGFVAIIAGVVLGVAQHYGLGGVPLVLMLVVAVVGIWLFGVVLLNVVNIRDWWRQQR